MAGVSGKIPAKLIYVSKPEEEVRLEWDDLKEVKSASFTIRPTFAVPADSPKMLELANVWAGQRKPRQLSRANSPFRLLIRGLEHRERGGRAFKVTDEAGHYFDLREDVLLDTIVNCNIRQGKVDARFIWAQFGSQMKLVRVGSQLHASLIAATTRSTMKDIKVTDLVPGGVYRNRKGEHFIVLGWASTLDYDYHHKRDANPHQGIEASAAYVEITEVPKILVYLTGLDDDIKELGAAGALKEFLRPKKKNEYHALLGLRTDKSLTVKEHVETIVLPSDLWKKVRRAAVKDILLNIFIHLAYNRTSSERQVDRLYRASDYAEYANLSPLPSLPAVQDEFKEYDKDLRKLVRKK